MLAAAELSRAGNVSRAKTGGGAPGFQARGLGLLWQSPQLFVANLGGAGREGGWGLGTASIQEFPGQRSHSEARAGCGHCRKAHTRPRAPRWGDLLECPLVTKVAFGTTGR